MPDAPTLAEPMQVSMAEAAKPGAIALGAERTLLLLAPDDMTTELPAATDADVEPEFELVLSAKAEVTLKTRAIELTENPSRIR